MLHIAHIRLKRCHLFHCNLQLDRSKCHRPDHIYLYFIFNLSDFASIICSWLSPPFSKLATVQSLSVYAQPCNSTNLKSIKSELARSPLPLYTCYFLKASSTYCIRNKVFHTLSLRPKRKSIWTRPRKRSIYVKRLCTRIAESLKSVIDR